MVRGSSCGPIACWILAQTSSLETWSWCEMRSILRQHLISMVRILLCSSAVRVHDSKAYRKMDVTRKRTSRILELREQVAAASTRCPPHISKKSQRIIRHSSLKERALLWLIVKIMTRRSSLNFSAFYCHPVINSFITDL